MTTAWIPAALPAEMSAEFVRLAGSWRLSDDQAAFLLQVSAEEWQTIRQGRSPVVDPEIHIRLRHCLDIEEGINTLAPGKDQGDWIRAPHSILGGRPPLYFLTTNDDALRSIRWTMLTETKAGFPQGPHAPGPPRQSMVERATNLVQRAIEASRRRGS